MNIVLLADGQAGALGNGAAVQAADVVDVDDVVVVVDDVVVVAPVTVVVVVVTGLPVGLGGAEVAATRWANPTVGLPVGVGVPF